MVTTLAAPVVSLGSVSRDVAYVSGPVVPGSTLTFAAYRQGDGDDLTGDQLVADTSENPVTIYHGGTYESPEVTFDAVGTYYWVETLTGPDGQVVHVGEPRVPGETTEVVRVTTTAQPTVSAGDAAHDVAVVEGTPPPGSTIGFEVYRQVEGDDPTLDEIVATLAPVEITGPETTSADVVLDAPGTYYWVETLYGPGGETVHVGEPRLPGETTVATEEPTAPATTPAPAQPDEPGPVEPEPEPEPESQPETVDVEPVESPLAATGARTAGLAAVAVGLLVAGLLTSGAMRARARSARRQTVVVPVPTGRSWHP